MELIEGYTKTQNGDPSSTNPDDAKKMVIAAPYIMEDVKHYAVVRNWDVDYFAKNGTFEFITPESIEKYRAATLCRYMPVAYSGMGMMLIAKGVLEDPKVTYPPFWRPLEQIPTGNADVPVLVDMSSEDVALCKNIADAGYKVWLDTSLRVGHHKALTI